MKYFYKNKYGSLEIEVIGPYQDVTKMRVKDQPSSTYFTINEAEKIALITGNKDIQIAFEYPSYKNACLVHHSISNPRLAAVCRIVSLDFNENIDAQAELSKPHMYKRRYYGV